MNTDPSFIHPSEKKLCALTNASVTVVDSIESTNSELLRRIRCGDTSAQLIAAKSQTSGRGRLGRSFSSGDGGIYFSFNTSLPLSAAESTGLITPAAGVAAVTSLRELYGADVKLKWVNDLILSRKKLGGILSESIVIGDTVHVVIGIGINITNSDLPDIATSLSEQMNVFCDASILIAHIVNGFSARLSRLSNIVDEYRQLLCHLGVPVRVHTFDGGDDYIAEAIDITPDCKLIVKTGGGETKILSSGEVSVRF